MKTVDLTCGAEVVRVDASIVEMSAPRTFASRFVAAAGAPSLTVHRVTGSTAPVVEGPMGSCRLEVRGPELLVEVGDGPFLGELVLRLAWYVSTLRQGGFLIHAAAVRDGERALVACGKSGDGKSTLSRLSVGQGLTLMTDEVVQLFPDGRVGGTPFRSDPDNPGTPGLARVRHFVALEKAAAEALTPLDAPGAARLILSQRFGLSLELESPAELRKRTLAFLASTRLSTLAFRKDPAAGRFVRGLLAEE